MKYKKLESIEHYKKFPTMIPFIGESYASNKHKKLLLIGESNYFPKDSKIHLSAEEWYNSNQDDLTDEEIEWIDCQGLLNCEWKSDGHFIYRELNSSINSLNFKYNNRPIDEVAFINFFQRPAEDGNSFRTLCIEKDVEVAINTISSVIEIIHPNVIVLTSKFAWDNGGYVLKDRYKEIYIDFVCHPGTGGRYWHNKEYPHGKKKFLSILKKKFI